MLALRGRETGAVWALCAAVPSGLHVAGAGGHIPDMGLLVRRLTGGTGPMHIIGGSCYRRGDKGGLSLVLHPRLLSPWLWLLHRPSINTYVT